MKHQTTRLVRIPSYSQELILNEKIWAYIKQYYKNYFFDSHEDIKLWLADFVSNKIDMQIVKSITHNKKYLNAFNAHIMV